MQDMTFESTDLGETEEFLIKAYTKTSIGGQGASSHARIVRRALGPIGLDELSFSYELSYDADPLGAIVLCQVRNGRIEENFIGEPTDVFAPGDVTLYSPPELPYSGRVCAATYHLTVFDSTLLDRVASSSDEHGDNPVRLAGHRPVSVAAKNRLGSLISYLRDQVFDDDDARSSPLLVNTAATHLAAATLQAFPSNAALEPTATERRDAARPALLRRAMAFIEENAHRDVAPSDIAAAVYLTPRAVQYMFRRNLDCTPTEYLRRVRLHRAHQELVACSPHETTVNAIAARWGFAHSGRFAAYYRQTFGRAPLATLRN